jgi:hypothetical protein
MQGLRVRGRATGAVLIAALALGTTGAAAAQAAPRLLAPGNGKVIAKGSDPIFKVHDGSSAAAEHRVWITISKTKARDKSGQLKYKAGSGGGNFSSMKRAKHGGWTYKAPRYSFPGWYLATAGTYYWQAFHIDCAVSSCHVYSRIRKFTVR